MNARITSDTLRIVQFTDMHLYADTRRDLLGVPTEQSFLDTVHQARRDHWPVDLVLATGDLAHDRDPAAYRRLHAHFAALAAPVYCLPGNHDDAVLMRAHLCDASVRCGKFVDQCAWRIVLLDSAVPDSDAGHLAAAELAQLEELLRDAASRHVLVCLHHNPVPIGSSWLDTMMVDNAAEFFAVLDQYPQVRGVLWGHVHQAYDQVRRGVRLLASPSTCIQFQPQSVGFALDEAAPGYRWLDLRECGAIETGVARLVNYSATLDRHSGGY